MATDVEAKEMEPASPARLYATVVGALLTIGGIVGFFYSASFGAPGQVDDMLGVFSVNAWHNTLHILTGALGLLVAGYAARQYAFCLGALYAALAIWGFALGSGESLLGFVPVDIADNVLHLVLGGLGILAAMATQKAAPASAATA